MTKIPYSTRVKLMKHFNKKLDSVELDLKDKLLLHTELDVLNGKVLRQIVRELNESIEKAQLDFMQKLAKEYEKEASSVSDAGVSTPKVGKTENFIGGAASGVTAGTAATTAAGLNFYTTGASVAGSMGHGGIATALTVQGKVAAGLNTVAGWFGHAPIAPITVAEVVAAKLGVTAVAVTAAMTAGTAIVAAAGTAYLMDEFGKPEKKREIKRELVKSYNDKIRPKLEDWAREQIDLCSE